MSYLVSLSYDLEITKGVNPHGVRPPVFVHIVDQVLLGERVDAAVGQRQLHLKITQCQLFFFKLCIFCDLVNQREGIFRVWLIPGFVGKAMLFRVAKCQIYYVEKKNIEIR